MKSITFNITNPFFRKAEHCMGYVVEAPESPVSKWVSSMSAIIQNRTKIKNIWITKQINSKNYFVVRTIDDILLTEINLKNLVSCLCNQTEIWTHKHVWNKNDWLTLLTERITKLTILLKNMS